MRNHEPGHFSGFYNCYLKFHRIVTQIHIYAHANCDNANFMMIFHQMDKQMNNNMYYVLTSYILRIAKLLY